MERVVIASACRTAIGKFGGSLKDVPTAELGVVVIAEALRRAGVADEHVDQVLMGCVLQAGQGQNVARQAALKAGLPVEVPALTTNVVCGSGLASVNLAADMIRSGSAEVVVAGGMENMDQAPFALPKARFGYRMAQPAAEGGLVDTMVNDALWDVMGGYHMGITAENVAARYGITRPELDEFAAKSQNKACAARAAGAFEAEIVPVMLHDRKLGDIEFAVDEGPREGQTAEQLARLKPCFKEGGVVTAANSSAINDGAAALVLMSESKASELGVEPLATFVAGALAGVEPEVMGLGPIAATRKLCAMTGLAVADFDLVEANEAFAAQSIAVARELGIAPERLNVNGGAIALGHPVGASGARILVTLLYAMRARGAHRGLATLCIGGGMCCATAIEMN